MKAKKELSKEIKDEMALLVTAMSNFIEEQSKRICTTDQDKIDFIMSAAINILGNFAIKYARNTIADKIGCAYEAQRNLNLWFDTVITAYQEREKNKNAAH